MQNDLDSLYEEAFKIWKERTTVIPSHITRFLLTNGINPFDYIKKSIVPKMAVYIPELEELNLTASGIEKIGYNAFTLCMNLKNVKLNEGLKEIETGAFMSCRGLKQIDLPSTLEVIHQDAFEDTGLTSLTIPRGVKSLKEGALKGIPNIQEITFEGAPEAMWAYIICDPAPRANKLVLNLPWTREYEKEQIAKKIWSKDWCFNRRFYKMNYRK